MFTTGKQDDLKNHNKHTKKHPKTMETTVEQLLEYFVELKVKLLDGNWKLKYSAANKKIERWEKIGSQIFLKFHEKSAWHTQFSSSIERTQERVLLKCLYTSHQKLHNFKMLCNVLIICYIILCHAMFSDVLLLYVTLCWIMLNNVTFW